MVFAFYRVVDTRGVARLAAGTGGPGASLGNAAGSDAVLAPRGASGDLGGGRRHDVPAAGECLLCHDTSRTPNLGFSTLQLSTDRDPGAPHAETPPPGAVDLTSLVASGRLVNLPDALVATPPRIAARTPTERAALGYLHGNCGGCHEPHGALSELEMDLRANAIATTVGRRDRLLARMSSRAPHLQMPPLGTRVVDDDAVALVARWITELEP
jgi:mono/diheme cytochrome c family protein